MKYTDSHEWIAVDGKEGTVGISAFASEELGEVVYLELPEVGTTVSAGDEVVVLESTKAAADIYAPLSGTIVAVNEKVKEDPSILSRCPESDGWLFKMTVDDEAELDTLLDHQQYHQLVN